MATTTPTYKLSYFDVKALAEPIRLLLSYGNAKWEDKRYTFKEWETVKKTMPFGSLPILEVDGKILNQSSAICRYLAKQYNLDGDTHWDSMQVDTVVDTLNDCRTLCSNYFRQKYFGIDPETKAKLRTPIAEEVLPFYFPKLEEIVKANNGYFVNGKLTWADVYWAAVSDSWTGAMEEDILKNYPHLAALQSKVFALPGIKEWIDKRPVTNY